LHENERSICLSPTFQQKSAAGSKISILTSAVIELSSTVVRDLHFDLQLTSPAASNAGVNAWGPLSMQAEKGPNK
jgi:hypothetical protein